MKVSPLYNFIAVATLLGAIQLLVDPANVPFSRRQDCGYYGISIPTCVTFGKLRLMFKNPIVFAKMGFMALLTVGGPMRMFVKSGFPKPAWILYAVMGLYTLFVTTQCRYDSNVPDGLPHCFH